MHNQAASKTFGFVEAAMHWADPMWWIWVSLLLLILCTIHFLPLELKSENHDFSDRVFLFMRRVCMVALVGLLVFALILYIGFGALNQGADQKIVSTMVLDWYVDMAKRYWTLPLAAVITGNILNFCWHRYGEPFVSNFLRKHRVNQAVDEYIDARKEVAKYATVRFDPVPLFMDGFYFVGKDEKGAPIYIDAAYFEETQTGLFAPTRFGKGVTAGVLLAQSVRRGNCVFMVDPKGDKNLPYILEYEAKKAGKPFVYLDLTPEGKGSWDPFKGGTIRDRRARMLSTYKLEPGGTNADVYKSKERTVVDKILATTDGSVRQMYEAVCAIVGKDDLSELRDGLAEWMQISTFTANRKRKGHSIEQSLLNGAVVYVKGSLNDGVIKRATRTYVSELIQESKRLDPQRQTHLTMFVDEVRFVMSNEIVDALATSAGFKTNMILATQAVSDLRNLEDKTIDGAALQQSFETNCQIKFIYKAGDAITAEWGEKLSGTKWIRVSAFEKLEVNRWGGEKWDKVRSMSSVEVPVIAETTFLFLPPMVFVLYVPNRLPEVVFTSWIDVDRSVCSWEKKEPDDIKDEPDVPAATPAPRSSGAGADATPKPTTAPKPKMRSNPKLANVPFVQTPGSGEGRSPVTNMETTVLTDPKDINGTA